MPGFAQLERVPFSLAVDPEDRFRLRGSDAPDFLHRLSASEARDLTARHLLFTDDKGSLVDAPLVVLAEDGFHLIASPGRGPALRAWFEKWIIMDDARVEPDPQESWRLGEPDLVAGDVIRPETTVGPTVLLGGIAPARVELAEWEAANFRAGRLYPGTATACGPNPLELGWKDLIAFDKGCYIGQEVIARMDSYDKVRRRLATVSLANESPSGAPLSVDGRKRGMVLASVQLEEGWFAWAVLDKSLETGAELEDATLISVVE